MSSSQREDAEEKSPKSRLIVLVILVLSLVGALIAGSVTTEKTRFTPDLALDLEGGTQIILTPVTTDGSQITDADVRQAIDIIRQRVDASGVAEAEISSQGGSNIIVALPGNPDQETLDLVRTSAVLRLRPVLAITDANALTPDDVVAALGAEGENLDLATMTDAELDEAIRQLADVDGDGEVSDQPATTPASKSDEAWITEQALYEAYTLQCGTQDARVSAVLDDSDKPFVACEPTGTQKFILGPAELEGGNIESATSSLAVNEAGTPTGGWAVNMNFDSEGSSIFADVTGRIFEMPYPQNLFGIVLDGQVLSAPAPSGAIHGGSATITGNFTSEEANTLANQLNFGSLPLHFEVQSEEQISATLGSEQLRSGLIAGLVGLLLIIAYMLWQYHGLGTIAIASILLSTGLSYLVISFLSWTMGYRLSMAGVLGIIISIGVTADSFIVYFERIRDEIRDGRTIAGAIEHGWQRARRTIIISDIVNLIAAVVLYLLTVGSVRGFAFTLGITTLLDLVVVMMFTYPVMTFVGRTAFFGQGKKWSGLDTERLESVPVYRGRSFSGRPEKTETKRRAVAPAMAGGGGEEVELHDYEFPDERFTDPELVGKSGRSSANRSVTASNSERSSSTGSSRSDDDVRPGESLAQRRARQRRERRDAERGEQS